jgi:hypothetical protein
MDSFEMMNQEALSEVEVIQSIANSQISQYSLLDASRLSSMLSKNSAL